MLRVCLAGITGWTAPPLVAALADADDLQLVAGVARRAAGRSLAEVTGLPLEGHVHRSVSDALADTPVDVLVDFTSAEAVGGNVRSAVEAGVHVVVGSRVSPRRTTTRSTGSRAGTVSAWWRRATSR